ncbi:tyrosine-type recombinase/integrase [Nitrosomonas marina]|nr:site-specific integrase [Nitrosomonas marina]
MHLRWLDDYLRGRTLDSITRDDIDLLTKSRSSEGVTNATTNRTLAVVRAILRRAQHEWEWIDKHPKIKMLPEPKKRIRWLTHDEADRLLRELPTHLRDMARFTLETGLRQSNVSGLTWSQVDIDRKFAWIHPDQAKAKKAIPVPLSEAAIQIILEQKGKNDTYIFTYGGNKIRNVSTKAWWKALDRAGIKDFRWHDLRHTWASWMVQNGCPLHVLQELGGWSNYEMVLRYAHLNSDHLSKYVNSLPSNKVTH